MSDQDYKREDFTAKPEAFGEVNTAGTQHGEAEGGVAAAGEMTSIEHESASLQGTYAMIPPEQPEPEMAAGTALPQALRSDLDDAPKRTVTFRVLRGAVVNEMLQQRTQDFTIVYDDSTTVLGALETIKGEQDGTLTFRRSCRASICGSCGMYINGRSRLACKTKVKDLVEGNPAKNIAAVQSSQGQVGAPDMQQGPVIELGPQRNQPVLKDLVVDIKPFYDKVEGIQPYVQDGPEKEQNVSKESFSQVNMVSNCIMCGACYSDCTSMVTNPNFIGPAALAKAFRFVSDPREGHKSERLKELSEKNGIWDCTRCGMCIDACPKGVAPMEAIVKLRSLAMDANITDNCGSRKNMSVTKDIQDWGVVNEPLMLLRAKGLGGALGQAGNALNLAKKGKIPNPLPFHHKPKGLDEVRKIFKDLKENPIDVQTKAADVGPGAG